MANDIASLGIRVTTDGVQQAGQQLDQLTRSGERAEAGLGKVGNASQRMSKQVDSKAIRDQREELAKLLGQIDPTVKALDRLDKQEAKLRSFRGKGLLDTETFEQYSSKIAQARTSLAQFDGTATKAGLSAKQLAFATRGLPAQFTDIAISLQSGQRPLQVFLQQGGQIKDTFGGVGPALAAMSRYVLGLINPLTILAGVLVAVGAAWKAGSDESVAFNQALITTGGYAGKTADQLAEMAEQLDDLSGVTTHSAAAGLAEVAASGKFTGEQFDLVAKAAVEMKGATGRAIDETVGEFDKLRRDPVNAILELNDKYHFLTQAQFDNIKSLKEQGRETEAVTAAFRVYAGEIDSRTPRIIDALSTTARLWRGVKSALSDVVDSLMAVGREGTTANKILQGVLLAYGGSTYTALLARGSKGGSGGKTPAAPGAPAIDSEQTRAALDFERDGLRFLTQKQRLEQDIKDARATGLKAGVSELEIEKRIAAIRASYAEKNAKKGGGGASIANSQLRDTLQGFKDEVALQQNALSNAQTILDEQYKSGLVSAEQYYDKLRAISADSANAQIAGIEKQIAALKSRTVAGKDAADTDRQIGQLEVQLAKARGDAATRQQVLDLQEKRAIDAKAESIRAYAEALQLSNAALSADFDSRVASVGLGRKEFEIQSAINAVLKEKADRLRELALQLQKGQRGESGGITQDQYDADVAALGKSMDERVKIIQDGYARIDEAQADWRNGAKAAFADYLDYVGNAAARTQELVAGSIGQLSDAFANFITGTKSAKDAFGDFADYLFQQSAKFVADQFIGKLLGGFTGRGSGDTAFGANSFGSGGGGFWASLLGAFTGNGGGFSDGGYTGPGGRNQVAGVVHAGEVVWSQRDIARAGGVGRVEAMRQGGGAPSTTVQQTFVIQGALDSSTRDQMARRSGREVETAMRRA